MSILSFVLFGSMMVSADAPNSVEAKLTDKTYYKIEIQDSRYYHLAELILSGYTLGDVVAGDLGEKIKSATSMSQIFKLSAEELDSLSKKVSEKSLALKTKIENLQPIPATQASAPTTAPSQEAPSTQPVSNRSWENLEKCFLKARVEFVENSRPSNLYRCLNEIPLPEGLSSFEMDVSRSADEVAVFLFETINTKEKYLALQLPAFDEKFQGVDFDTARKLWLYSRAEVRKNKAPIEIAREFFNLMSWDAENRKALDSNSFLGKRYLSFCESLKKFTNASDPIFFEGDAKENALCEK